MIKKITVLFLIAIALTSCVSRKKIVYFQNVSSISDNNYEPKVQPDDEVLIIVNVTSPNEALAAPFNQSSVINLTPGAGAGPAARSRRGTTARGARTAATWRGPCPSRCPARR